MNRLLCVAFTYFTKSPAVFFLSVMDGGGGGLGATGGPFSSSIVAFSSLSGD